MSHSKFLTALTALSCLLLSFSAEIRAQVGFDVETFAGPFNRPVFMAYSPDGTGRLFVVEQRGLIKILDADGNITNNSFLNVSNRLSSGNEQGLLSMAFHPDFSTNRFFYISYTDTGGDSNIVRFSVDMNDANAVDLASEKLIIEYDQDFSNHNGGQIAFGPDGMLYIASGDGGSGDDPLNRAQQLNTLLGKMLRIDVDAGDPYAIPPDNPFVGVGGGVREEIWAYGLRNPWRFSFDRDTGDMWCGDVGQNAREEVNIIRPGENYGWKIMEADICRPPTTGCDMTSLTLPVIVYQQSSANGRSITGGYVYRGNRLLFKGTYFFADFLTGRVWSFQPGGGINDIEIEISNSSSSVGRISSFAEDADGELYVIYLERPNVANSGSIRRVTGPRDVMATHIILE
jgi:glucose/arabinose dehydrogenase